MRSRAVGFVAAGAVLLAGCGNTEPAATSTSNATSTEASGAASPEALRASTASNQRHPAVVAAELEPSGEAWVLSATISSPYDSADRYADAFRAVVDGDVLGVRELAHPHADEQPFTRSLQGLEIPDGVPEITVEGRDSVNGWGGDTVTVAVPS